MNLQLLTTLINFILFQGLRIGENMVNVMRETPDCKEGKGDGRRNCNNGECMKGR